MRLKRVYGFKESRFSEAAQLFAVFDEDSLVGRACHMDSGCMLVPSNCDPPRFSCRQVTYYHALGHLYLVACGVLLTPFPFSCEDYILLVSLRNI